MTFAAITLEFLNPDSVWLFPLLEILAIKVYRRLCSTDRCCWSFLSKGCAQNFCIFSIILIFWQLQTFHIWTKINLEYFWEKSMWNISKANLLIVSFHMFLSFMLFLKFVDTFTVWFFYHLGNFQNIWQMFFSTICYNSQYQPIHVQKGLILIFKWNSPKSKS